MSIKRLVVIILFIFITSEMAYGKNILVMTTNYVWNDGINDNTYGIALGDYDGDGDLDLAVANDNFAQSAPNKVYTNNGKGEFGLAWTSTESEDSGGVQWVNIDGDSDLELAVGNYGQTVRIYDKQAGVPNLSSIWTSIETPTCFFSVDAGDIDGDGDIDIVVANDGGANYAYTNSGAGFGSNAYWQDTDGETTYGIVLADFDGKNGLDLAVANLSGSADQKVRIYTNDGKGNFGNWWVSGASNDSYTIDAGDYDGDGDMDLLVGNNGIVKRIYRNEGNGNFVDSGALNGLDESAATVSAIFVDIDNDGDLDVVMGNYGNQDAIYTNDGNGNYGVAWKTASSFNTTCVRCGDIDGDGDLDLMAGVDGGENVWYRNDMMTPPTNVVVTPAAQSLIVSWASNRESNLAGYTLYLDIDSGAPYVYKTNLNKNITCFTITSLPYTNYYIALRAYSTNTPVITSDYSVEVVAAPLKLPAPQNLELLGTATTVTLKWSSVALADGYKIYYDTDSSNAPFNGTGLNQGDSAICVTNTNIVLTGFNQVSHYYFRVTATNSIGEGYYSSAVIKYGDTAAPAKVQNLSAVAGNKEVTLNWGVNPDTDTAGYLIYYKMDVAGSPYNGTGANEGNSPVTNWGKSNTSVKLTGLMNGHTYYFVVKAFDYAYNKSEPSAEVFAIPLDFQNEIVKIANNYIEPGEVNPVTIYINQNFGFPVEIKILDIMGNIVKEIGKYNSYQEVKSGIKWYVGNEDIPDGLYFIMVENDKKKEIKKLYIIK